LRKVVDVKEESEKEDEPLPKSVKKTPRKSVKEDPGAFSDYNPFQSGSEAAADRERRRRRVSQQNIRLFMVADTLVVYRGKPVEASST
jgi:hypothetical protein